MNLEYMFVKSQQILPDYKT